MNHRVASAGKTVEYRLSNQLTPDVKNMIGITGDPTRADYGFGPGLAVRTTAGIVHACRLCFDPSRQGPAIPES